MQQRYVRFDMNELARLAANAVGAKEVINIEKCAEGLFNKAFLFSFEDGRQAVGKVPNPVAITPHLTTASEVATMEFVCPRAKLYGLIVLLTRFSPIFSLFVE